MLGPLRLYGRICDLKRLGLLHVRANYRDATAAFFKVANFGDP